MPYNLFTCSYMYNIELTMPQLLECSERAQRRISHSRMLPYTSADIN